MTKLLEGVAYLHANNIVHGDLKPNNIILKDKKSLSIKIIDFGFSKN